MRKLISVMAMAPLALALVVAALLSTGCENMSVGEMGTSLAASTGVISQDQKRALDRSGAAVVKAFKDMTPEQEYYIGRSVGATIVSKYKVYDKPALTEYVNVLGQTLSQFSDKPETYGGYHFLVLDSDEINAFAAPGGLIFVSRGMIRLCKDEDDLAAVLAHEIGHVQNEDGLRAIKKSRWTDAAAIIGTEATKSLTGQDLLKLTELFEGTVTDITTSLVNKGYSRTQERGADAAGIMILKRSGYNPHALIAVLTEMGKKLKPEGMDFAKTHPKPATRIEYLTGMVEGVPNPTPPAVGTERFKAATSGV